MTLLEIALALAKIGYQCKVEIEFVTTGITHPRAEAVTRIYTKTARDSAWQPAGRLVGQYRTAFLIIPMDNSTGQRLMRATERVITPDHADMSVDERR